VLAAGCLGDDGGDGSGSGGGGDGGSSGSDGSAGDAEVRAAFANAWDPSEDNWTQRHYDARMAMEDRYDWLETAGSYAIPPAEAEQVMRDYAEQGYDVIMGNNLLYMDPMQSLSEEYPDIAWENATGIRSGDNLAYYQVKAFETHYVAGIVAGMVTETDTIGFNAPQHTPYTARQMNGWALGARRVNPNVTCKVNYIGAWANASEESASAQSLIDDGCDALSSTSNIPATTRTAAENGVWSMTRYMSARDQNPDNYISSGIPRWELHHETVLEQVRNDEWEPVNRWNGFAEDWQEMDDWGKNVPQDAIDEAETAREEIAGGMDPFEGTRFADMSDAERYTELTGYVEGIEGEPPS